MRNQQIREWGFYLGTSLVLFCFFVSAFPSASFVAEPFAETAIRYFAEFPGVFDFSYLLKKDFGYFGLLPRSIYFFLEMIVGDSAFPVVTQTAVLLIMSMTMALFVFNVFEPVVKSRLLRLMTVLLVASGHAYGMFLLHNCGYCFVYPVCYGLALFGVTGQHKKFMVILAAVMTVFIWSKGFSVAVIPALAYGIFDRIKRKDYFIAACFGAVLVVSLPQFYAVFQARNSFDAKPLSLFTILANTFYLYVYSWRFFSFGGDSNYQGALNQFFGTLVVLIVVWLRFLTLKGERGSFLRSSFVATQSLILGGLGLFVLNLSSELVDFSRFPGFGTDSYFFTSRVAIAFSLGLVFSWCFEKMTWKPVQVALIAFVLVRCGVVNYIVTYANGKQDPYSDKSNSASEWNTYYPLMQKKVTHTIPVNPPGWFAGWPPTAIEDVSIYEKDTNTFILSSDAHSGIQAICVFPLDPEIHHLEVRSKTGDVFIASSLRKGKSSYPCFNWPKFRGICLESRSTCLQRWIKRRFR